MGSYAVQGFTRFLIANGHLHNVVVEWVEETFIAGSGSFAREIVVEDTGEETQTAGRTKGWQSYLDDAPFMLTYGYGFADVNLSMLIDHRKSLQQPGLRKPVLTLTAVHPPARFGNLGIDGGRAVSFGEKSQLPNDWINGGFYIVEPSIFNLIPGDDTRLEYDRLPALATFGGVGKGSKEAKLG